MNLDGWEDFVVGVNDADPRIFINSLEDRSPNRPLRIRLTGAKGNPTAIGAVVTVAAKGLEAQTSEISAGGSYLSQSSSDLIFAVPKNNSETVAVTIQWADGNMSQIDAEAEIQFLALDRK